MFSRQRLHGATVFLSAGVPTSRHQGRYLRVTDAPARIDDAVKDLARAVFSEGGRLVFGGHPAISPLVAMVAGEYRQPAQIERTGRKEPTYTPIIIYQSLVFKDRMPEATREMELFRYAQVRWTEVAPGELDAQNSEQARQSLLTMRQKMISETQPIAMVCIGGMDGVIAEVELFRQLTLNRRGVFTLPSTGGAASILTKNEPIIGEVERSLLKTLYSQKEANDDPSMIPYPLIMQTIVERIAHIREIQA